MKHCWKSQSFTRILLIVTWTKVADPLTVGDTESWIKLSFRGLKK